MNDNSAAQDELQQAINSITNAANADSSDSNEAVAQIENRLSGKDKKPAPVEKAKKEDTKAVDEQVAALTNAAPLAPPVPAPVVPNAPVMPTFTNGVVPPLGPAPKQASYGDPDLDRVKSSALSDLRPIIDRIDLPAEKKFEVYKEIIDAMNDKACIEPAYNAAKDIADEKVRAEALLYVIEAINRLGVQEIKK